MATTGETPCMRTFSICFTRLAPPAWTSSGFSASSASGSGRPATIRWRPECTLSARTVATSTAASGAQPRARHLMLKNFSAPMSAPKPASVTRKSPEWMPIRSATTDELPWAMLPNGPAWTSTGVFSSVCMQVRLDGLAHDHGHRAGRLELLGGHRLAVGCSRRRCGRAGPAGPASDVARARTAITSEAAVMSKPVWRGTPSCREPEADHDVAQRPVVHVEHPAPGDVAAGRCRASLPWWRWLSTMADEQVVGRGDGVHVAGQVEVEVLHRHDLAVTAAGRAALDAEGGAHRRLADGDRGPLADVAEGLPQPDRRGRLPLAERRRGDGGDDDVPGPGPVGQLARWPRA